MSETQIRFEDGAAYERMMGKWSRLVGEVFLDWLAPPKGLRWVDVGCGNGAFTELLVDRVAPAGIDGIDPAPAQLAFARSRPAAKLAKFHQGDAMALPFGDDAFDAAVMALVIFFVPDPAKGVAEMLRVAKPGGWVSAYAWDIPGGGLPLEVINEEMRGIGITPLMPPSAAISRLESLRALWTAAGLREVAARAIAVTRTFVDFEDFWTTSLGAGNLGRVIAELDDKGAKLKSGVRARLPASGPITITARANAVKGRVPE